MRSAAAPAQARLTSPKVMATDLNRQKVCNIGIESIAPALTNWRYRTLVGEFVRESAPAPFGHGAEEKQKRLSPHIRRSRDDIRGRTSVAIGPERIEHVISRLIGLPVDIRAAPGIDQAGGFGDVRSVPLTITGWLLHQRVQPFLVGRIASDIELEQIEACRERFDLNFDDVFFGGEYLSTCGTAIAASKPRIARTTSNSISVKPSLSRFAPSGRWRNTINEGPPRRGGRNSHIDAGIEHGPDIGLEPVLVRCRELLQRCRRPGNRQGRHTCRNFEGNEEGRSNDANGAHRLSWRRRLGHNQKGKATRRVAPANASSHCRQGHWRKDPTSPAPEARMPGTTFLHPPGRFQNDLTRTP